MHSGWTLTASPGQEVLIHPRHNEETCVPLVTPVEKQDMSENEEDRTGPGAQSSPTSCIVQPRSPGIEISGILARGGYGGEAGKIREGLFCPAWTWGLWETGNHQKILWEGHVLLKRLSCQKNEEWTGGNKMESCLCSHLVCWLVRSKE